MKKTLKKHLKGVFLATGSVNDPSKSKYHLEFLIDDEDSAKMVQKIMIGFRYTHFSYTFRNV